MRKFKRKFSVDVGKISDSNVDSIIKIMRENIFNPFPDKSFPIERRIKNLKSNYSYCMRNNDLKSSKEVLNNLIKYMTDKIIKDHC